MSLHPTLRKFLLDTVVFASVRDLEIAGVVLHNLKGTLSLRALIEKWSAAVDTFEHPLAAPTLGGFAISLTGQDSLGSILFWHQAALGRVFTRSAQAVPEAASIQDEEPMEPPRTEAGSASTTVSRSSLVIAALLLVACALVALISRDSGCA